MYKLQYYTSKFSHLALQGSQDWLEGKSYSFGGSEMACILDKSKHDKWKDMKRKKILKLYDYSDITEWGHLFEAVSKIIIRKEHGTIYEFGSIPHPYYPVCYSPDGILVKDDDLVLLEIKNPVMRGIKSVPEEYKYQVYTGMDIINVKHCLFAQFRFRRCRLGTNSKNCDYDRYFHKEFIKRQKPMFPISYGYLYWNVDCKLIDLSSVENMCEYIFKYNVKPEIYIECLPKPLNHPRPNSESSQTSKDLLKGLILMWKLFEYNYSIIEPKRDFLKLYEDKLWSRYKDLYYTKILQKSMNTKTKYQKREQPVTKLNEIIKLKILSYLSDKDKINLNLAYNGKLQQLCKKN